MDNGLSFAYTMADSQLGEAGLRPHLPLTLRSGGRSLSTVGLLDTGAMVNVLPYDIGMELGFQWEQESVSVQLTGNLAQFDARAVILRGAVGSFEPAKLAFAWTKANNVPLILGQVNFFMEFDVCFYRSQLAFVVRPKQAKSV